jgi:phosphate:Na+ symporter
VVIAAGLTWAAHSSVAIVLLVMSLAAKGVVPPDAAFALVFGANLGTALNPLLEMAEGSDAAARRVPAGNLGTRLVGVALGLALLPKLGPWVVTIVPDPARAVADLHLAFNLVLAALFFPILPYYAALLRRLFPARVDAPDPSRSLYLDERLHVRPRWSQSVRRHGRRYGWPICWKQCCTLHGKHSRPTTASGSRRPDAWMTCWID